MDFIWRRTVRFRAVARVLAAIGLNMIRIRIERLWYWAFGRSRRIVPEPPQIQRLQTLACSGAPSPELVEATALEVATGRAEVLVDVLVFCFIRDVAHCAAVATDFLGAAERDDLWHHLCLQRWRTKEHSVHMRRWLVSSGRQTKSEDLYLEYACEEQRRHYQKDAEPSQQILKPCRVTSWRDRYIFAERDSKRTAITPEELCLDSPFYEDGVTSETKLRRWYLALRFGHAFDREAFFHLDGKFSDTGRFRQTSAPWSFVYAEHGEVMVKIRPPDMDFEPMRVERTETWGWKLISTGRLADMVHFFSRQLSPQEHVAASSTPTEIVTLYLRRMHLGEVSHDPYGTWTCFKAYQGTMEAPSWTRRQLTIERESLTITLSNGDHQTCRCSLDDLECTIDIAQGLDDGDSNEQIWEHGVYQMERNGRVLVATRNEIPGGPRPSGPPDTLPSINEILNAAMPRDEAGDEACHGYISL